MPSFFKWCEKWGTGRSNWKFSAYHSILATPIIINHTAMLRHCGNAVKRCLGACSAVQKKPSCLAYKLLYGAKRNWSRHKFLKTTLLWMVEGMSFLHHTVLIIGKINIQKIMESFQQKFKIALYFRTWRLFLNAVVVLGEHSRIGFNYHWF